MKNPQIKATPQQPHMHRRLQKAVSRRHLQRTCRHASLLPCRVAQTLPSVTHMHAAPCRAIEAASDGSTDVVGMAFWWSNCIQLRWMLWAMSHGGAEVDDYGDDDEPAPAGAEEFRWVQEVRLAWLWGSVLPGLVLSRRGSGHRLSEACLVKLPRTALRACL